MVLTRSITGLGGTAGLLLLLAFGRIVRRMGAREKVIMISVFSVFALVIAALIFFYAKDILPLFGKDLTLSGRTKIWRSVLLSIEKRPWLGYGHGGFWIGEGEAINTVLAANWGVTYAHSGFLDVMLQLGFAGLALVLFAFLKSVKDTLLLLRQGVSGIFLWCLSILFLTLLFNLDEGTFLLEERIYWLLFLVVSLFADQARRSHSIVPIATGQMQHQSSGFA